MKCKSHAWSVEPITRALNGFFQDIYTCRSCAAVKVITKHIVYDTELEEYVGNKIAVELDESGNVVRRVESKHV
jgi:hypothetical protein